MEADSTAAGPDGLAGTPRLLAILVVSIGVVAAVLDQSIANVALPTMARALHTTPARSVWVVNAYQLAVVGTILPAAALGEIVGYRRVYQWGVAVFTVGSLLCALSRNLPELAASRVLQGLGAAGLMGVNGALVRFIYPRAMLGRGIGRNALVVSVAATLGPGLASLVLSLGSWPWLFAINVPLGLAIVALARRCLPASPRSGHRLDGASAGLNALAFAALFIGADALIHGRGGWLLGAPALGIAGVAGTALYRRERRSPRPLIPIDLLRRPVLGLSAAASVCAFSAFSIAMLTMPFFLQTTLHRSTATTGLLMMAWPAALAAVALVSGRLSDRMSAAILGGLGMACLAAGLALLATLSGGATDAGIAARLAVAGMGMGLFQTPNNRTMLSAAPRARAGAASGMLATARLTGLTTGAMLAASMFHVVPGHANEAGCGLAVLLALTAGVLSLSRRGTAPAAEAASGAPEGETRAWTRTRPRS